MKPKWKKICAVFGEDVVTDQMCQKWWENGDNCTWTTIKKKKEKKLFAKFHDRDAPWTSRPVEVYSNQIKTLMRDNKCYTMLEIADILKVANQ